MPRRNTEPFPSSSRVKARQYTLDRFLEAESDEEDGNIEVITTNFVKYIVQNSSNKLPIKRNDLTRNLGVTRKNFDRIFDEARRLLNEIYGLELIEIQEKTTKAFITFPTVELASVSMVNDEVKEEIFMLFVVLSYIFMKSGGAGEIQESILLNFLEKLHIDMDEFSKTKEIFIKQLYLKRRKVEIEGKNEVIILYSWGERALHEFDRKDILNSVAKLVKKHPSSFESQHKEVYGEDVEMTIN